MIKNALYLLGAVFIVVGLLGFFNNPILGIFKVNLLHNLIHLISGVLAIVFAGRGEMQARMFAKVFGVVYLLVGVLGFVPGLLDKLIAANHPSDTILHLLLGVVFLVLGFAGASKSSMSSNM